MQEAPSDWFKRAAQALEGEIQRAIVPIYAGSYERGSIGGTGTLFRIADATFLVTAAHVTDQRGGGTLLALSDGPDRSVPTPLREHFHSFPSPYDVAVARLDAETTASLPSRAPLTLAHVDLSRTRGSGGRFAISGFPLVRSTFDYERRVSRADRFTHEIVPYRGDTNSLEGFSRDFNVAFVLDRYASPDTPSTLQGISGCSVIRLARDSESPFTWSPRSARIVAVQTSQYKRDDCFVVRGTIWPVVMELLWRQFSDLRPAMQVTADHQGFRILMPS